MFGIDTHDCPKLFVFQVLITVCGTNEELKYLTLINPIFLLNSKAILVIGYTEEDIRLDKL